VGSSPDSVSESPERVSEVADSVSVSLVAIFLLGHLLQLPVAKLHLAAWVKRDLAIILLLLTLFLQNSAWIAHRISFDFSFVIVLRGCETPGQLLAKRKQAGVRQKHSFLLQLQISFTNLQKTLQPRPKGSLLCLSTALPAGILQTFANCLSACLHARGILQEAKPSLVLQFIALLA
jgi:hypothetical protein